MLRCFASWYGIAYKEANILLLQACIQCQHRDTPHVLIMRASEHALRTRLTNDREPWKGVCVCRNKTTS